MPNDGTWNEQTAEAAIRHRLALLRYEAGASRELLKAYSTALGDIDRAFLRLHRRVAAGQSIDRAQLERLIALGNDIRTRITELERIARLEIQGRLEEVAEAEQRFQRAAFAAFAGAGHPFAAVPEAAVATMLGGPLGGRIWTDRLAMDLLEEHAAITGVLAVALAKGASIPNVAKALRQGTGIVETYRGRLVAIARTEIQRVANTVALRTYDENRDVLSGVQWLATLDSRTCLVCAPLHNQVYRYDEHGRLPADFQQPPLHPRCRCFCVPISKADADLDLPPELRGFFGDEPAQEVSFDAWLRRQDAPTQREVFGSEARRDAWRSGALDLSQFSDRGRVLSLGELRSRYPEMGA